ncbi:BCL-6 corepressor isoform X2 [Lepisosteus oculatus]|uniref:BCL-6 corepressor isoform X2 n=1 Tax=Lepisosteus oculatus TaxID=7918 RepID=UPI0035F52652
MLSATPLYGTIHNWVSNERVRMCGINEERKVPVADGEPQKNRLELREENHITPSMVDAGAACRMNTLAALSMDRNALMRESLRVHGGMVYPGIRALSADKAREGSSMPLGYVSDRIPELHYKPAEVTLENRKHPNGYGTLYKSPPPGLQKPMMVPGGGAEALGLDRRVGPADKQSELGLNGSTSYLRLPWVPSPYPEAGVYPFLDSTKYALSMYKASFMSQHSPYLPQPLAYQSVCAGGGSAGGSERFLYLPPYPPSPITASLAPPMRIPTATVAPSLSPLVHCQEKSMQSIGPRIHHEPSAFGQQLHQQQPQQQQQQQQAHHQSHSDRQHSSSKQSRAPSSKGPSSSSNSGSSGHSVDSASVLLMQSPRTAPRLHQPSAPPPHSHMESPPDFQKPLPRGPPTSSSSSSCSSSSSSSSQSVSLPFPFMAGLAPEHPSPARPAGQKPKAREGSAEHRSGGGERKASKSPCKTVSEKQPSQAPTKDPADKPLDLSAKIASFGAPPNGFSPKLEGMAKLGQSPTARYGLPSRDLLKDSPSFSAVGTSSKPPDRPEIISNLHSSWVVPGHTPLTPESSQNIAPPVIKNKTLERVMHQQRSSSCPRIGESNNSPAANPAPTLVPGLGRPASASPSPNVNGEWPKANPNLPEKVTPASHAGSQSSSGQKASKPPKRVETQDITHKPQQQHLDNGPATTPLYLPQNEAFLPPSLAYANRYMSYSEGLPLPHLPLAAKGPVYPHPVLLGSGSLYPAHLAPKHGLPYGLSSSHREFLTYHDSQEMVHPLMTPLTLDPKPSERLERRSRSQDRPRHNEEPVPKSRPAMEAADPVCKPEKEAERGLSQGSKPPSKPPAMDKEKIVCIDLLQDDADGGSLTTKHCFPISRKGDAPRHLGGGDCEGSRMGSGEGKEPELKQLLLSNQTFAPRPADSERQPEICSPPKLQDHGPCGEFLPARQDPARRSPAQPCPLPELLEQQTLRCARTSGDRAGEEAGLKGERQGPGAPRPLEAGKDEDVETQEEEEEGEEDSHSSSRPKKSNLAKRIANSSGYVGDRFKCVTTELYADSSKLSREQRALQRAMMRFSELELKEKEGSGATGKDLADGQPGESAGEAREQAAQHGCAVLREEPARDGVPPVSGNHKSAVLQGSGAERGEEDGGPQGEKRGAAPPCEEQFPCSRSADGQERRAGEHIRPAAPPAPARKRKHSREGVSGESAAEEEEEEEEEEEDRTTAAARGKRKRMLADDWPEKEITNPSSEHLLEDSSCKQVKNLKVCIELTGLRLRKQRPLQELRQLWEQQVSPQRSVLAAAPPPPPPPPHGRKDPAEPCPPEVTARDRKVKGSLVEEKPTKKRSEGKVNRSWSEEPLCKSDIEQGLPVPPVTSPHTDCLDSPPPDAAVSRKPPLAAATRLSDKRQRLKEHRKASGLGPPSPGSGKDAETTPWLRRHSDLEKPKGKRQCKTKHISLRDRRRASQTAEESADLESPVEQKVSLKRSTRKRSASVSDYESSPVKSCNPAGSPAAPQTPTSLLLLLPPPVGNPPAETPTSRPMPPEARRLIVNKNAGETLLQRAARLGYEEVVLYCLENKVCDVNHRDNAGYCALHEACARGWFSIVQHLLEHGADVNCSAQDGTRPLHDAVENDHLDTVRLLLSYGADPTLATYSGRSVLKMTHSELMEAFLSDYFADLQGRGEDDPGLYWDFYGSSVCEPAEDAAAFDILANPPGPGETEEEQRDVFEFEFSDRPLLPCYNIQVSVSQGPRNWLLLSDVLKRLKMTARAFRAAFSHIEVATIAEAEFYKQASLSQLFSCPEELEGFVPDSKELLDLVEFTAELVALLGSSLECLDTRWDPLSSHGRS